MPSTFTYSIQDSRGTTRYVGISVDPHKRWKRHVSEAKNRVSGVGRAHKNPHLANIINLGGATMVVLAEHESRSLAEAHEMVLIGSIPNLVNLTEGGDGMTPESARKAHERRKAQGHRMPGNAEYLRSLTADERRINNKKRAKTLGHDHMSDAAKAVWAKRTPAERSAIARKSAETVRLRRLGVI